MASVIYAGHGDINGQEGIVGVAVHYGNKGRVHALTIMAPDGSEFEITNNADKVESGGRKSVNSTDLSASIVDDTSKTAGRQAKKSSRARVIDRSNEELDNATNTTLQIWRVVQLVFPAFAPKSRISPFWVHF